MEENEVVYTPAPVEAIPTYKKEEEFPILPVLLGIGTVVLGVYFLLPKKEAKPEGITGEYQPYVPPTGIPGEGVLPSGALPGEEVKSTPEAATASGSDKAKEYVEDKKEDLLNYAYKKLGGKCTLDTKNAKIAMIGQCNPTRSIVIPLPIPVPGFVYCIPIKDCPSQPKPAKEAGLPPIAKVSKQTGTSVCYTPGTYVCPSPYVERQSTACGKNMVWCVDPSFDEYYQKRKQAQNVTATKCGRLNLLEAEHCPPECQIRTPEPYPGGPQEKNILYCKRRYTPGEGRWPATEYERCPEGMLQRIENGYLICTSKQAAASELVSIEQVSGGFRFRMNPLAPCSSVAIEAKQDGMKFQTCVSKQNPVSAVYPVKSLELLNAICFK